MRVRMSILTNYIQECLPGRRNNGYVSCLFVYLSPSFQYPLADRDKRNFVNALLTIQIRAWGMRGTRQVDT